MSDLDDKNFSLKNMLINSCIFYSSVKYAIKTQRYYKPLESGKWKTENERISSNFPFSVFHFPLSSELFPSGLRRKTLTEQDLSALLLYREHLLFGENKRWKH
ncbi:MAG: hypothetical protein WA584_16640 [Pyrinomonadaceae bacterium]